MRRVPTNLQNLGVRDWPYSDHEGVDLEFSGAISDELKFTRLLADYGCHPKASARIIERMRQHGVTQVTITATVPNPQLKEALYALGVEMKVIAPSAELEEAL